MPQVAVTIAGRPYRMACGEGEEEHLLALAARLDAKIGEMRKTFGEIGDSRITVMAALTIADELSDAERRLAAMQVAVEAAEATRRAAEDSVAQMGDSLAEQVEAMAQRVERLSRAVAAAARS